MTSSDSDPRLAVYSAARPLLFGIAYRMVGSVADAEDIVQDAFVRFRDVDLDHLENPKAYLAQVTTRLAIDELRRAKSRRESYVGSWLPEPVLEAPAVDPAEPAELADSLSMAFLLLLERLSPVERAVFLLHDVFDFGYDEVARFVGKSQDNARQIASRARRRIDEQRPRFETSAERRDELARRFVRACQEGEVSDLVQLLAADVTLYGDGGGKAPAVPAPVSGRERVGQILTALVKRGRKAGLRLEQTVVNGQPGGLWRDAAGRVANVFALDIEGGQIVAVRSVVNPDKLRHLGPVLDMATYLREQSAAARRDEPPGGGA
jgi:RNA polymerase sigma-70 factor (ECF subfamily)